MLEEVPYFFLTMKSVLHIEVVQRANSNINADVLSNLIKEDLLQLDRDWVCTATPLHLDELKMHKAAIKEHVESITVCELNNDDTFNNIELKNVDILCHVYRLNTDGPQSEMMEDESEGVLSAANHWILPSYDLHGLWESLIYDSTIKDNLLSFVETTLLFSDHSVDANIISWNRVVLLHGPPGTGKTSLCKALAQKLAIRLGHRYTHGELIEINSHSLFSKWFSESGKLVMKMFSKINELIDDPQALVCVLIDEVESLTHARQSSMNGTEPSDSIRVVNAVLTQIDQIRRYPNVLILTTSNLTAAIDLAFVDRADIKQYIGPPSADAIYQIYLSCIKELQKKSIIMKSDNMLQSLKMIASPTSDITEPSAVLLNIARQSEGLSGRTLRKLPFLAHAHFVKKSSVSLDHFLVALSQAVSRQFMEREAFEK